MGAHENSDSPYGTFDQGGNAWGWNEAVLYGSYRGLRGGSFITYDNCLHASYRYYYNGPYPSCDFRSIGFRVVEVPEPATIVMLALASVGIIRRRKPPPAGHT